MNICIANGCASSQKGLKQLPACKSRHCNLKKSTIQSQQFTTDQKLVSLSSLSAPLSLLQAKTLQHS